MTSDAFTEMQQDLDAETVASIFPPLYADIVSYVEQGWTLERIEAKIKPYFALWQHRDHYVGMCLRAARSISRKHPASLSARLPPTCVLVGRRDRRGQVARSQAELAREALANVCTCLDPIRPGPDDDPNCPVHGLSAGGVK